jgi:hypothetical protein
VGLNQEQFTTRAQELKRNIDRLYEEMYSDEVIHQRIFETKRDQIRRLAAYYKEQINLGICFDRQNRKVESTHQISRMILEEMDDPARRFSDVSKREVNKALGDEYKRAWRQPWKTDGKQSGHSLEMDAELKIFYEEHMEHINELLNFDYFELPQPLRVSLAEHFYRAQKHHDKEWTKHGLQVVKHQADGYYVPDRFPDIIRIEETEPYEGELYDAMKSFKKTWTEMMKKVKTQRPPNLTVEMEHEWAMGVKVWEGLFKPWGNFKWKKELYGWSGILKRRILLRNKCAAAKSSRIETKFDNITQEDWKEAFEEEMKPRGITREEIDKNHLKLIKFFQQFMRHYASIIVFAQSFDGMTATFRARHSVRLHEKLSHNS